LTTGAAVKKKRVVSGMRPTGRLHIGHYFGALANWERLQNDPAYECFYFIADWHALTSDYADTSDVAQNTIEITTDYLAAGIDPEKSVIFQQSQVEEHAELHLLLSMVTPLGWLERVPTYKEALENVKDKDLHTYGFLGYPTLQTADIVIYSEDGVPLFVPVGEDQVSHIELSREIVKKFNFHNIVLDAPALMLPENTINLVAIEISFGDRRHLGYGGVSDYSAEQIYQLQCSLRRRISEVGVDNLLQHVKSEIGKLRGEVSAEYWETHLRQFVDFTGKNPISAFLKQVLVEPREILTTTPRIPGLDGRKMSKSYGNAITLSESDADIRAKTKVMKTDPARQRRTDPGNPDVCPVFDWHKLFSSAETQKWAAAGCRSAGIGCIECKAKMADGLIQWIGPVRERRVEYEKNPGRVLEILDEGSHQAREVARQTMRRVREAVFGWNKKRKEILRSEGTDGVGVVL
jgi:tryptophanyl-tRNA synthetase